MPRGGQKKAKNANRKGLYLSWSFDQEWPSGRYKRGRGVVTGVPAKKDRQKRRDTFVPRDEEQRGGAKGCGMGRRHSSMSKEGEGERI